MVRCVMVKGICDILYPSIPTPVAPMGTYHNGSTFNVCGYFVNYGGGCPAPVYPVSGVIWVETFYMLLTLLGVVMMMKSYKAEWLRENVTED